jgi:hypothetical protein
MSQRAQRLTLEEVKQLKAIIRTGEPLQRIAERMAPQYNRTVSSFYVTLYNLSKRTYKIAEWNGPKRRRTKNTTAPATPETAVMETPRTPTQKIARVERYDDHIRIYF